MLRHSNKVAESTPDWGNVDKAKLPPIAFAYVPDEESVSTWKLPHHWVQDGGDPDDLGRFTSGDLYLHPAGVAAAWAALEGSRTGEPMDVPASVKAHIKAHRDFLISGDEESYTITESAIMKKMGLTDSEIKEIQKRSKETGNPITREVPILKMDVYKRQVTGVVYEPNEVDAQGHYMTPEEIEKMAYMFMKRLQLGYAGIDVMHYGDNGAGIVIESFVAKDDCFEGGKLLWKKGSWVLTTEVQDMDVWEKILKGEYTGYSLAGFAEYGNKMPVEYLKN